MTCGSGGSGLGGGGGLLKACEQFAGPGFGFGLLGPALGDLVGDDLEVLAAAGAVGDLAGEEAGEGTVVDARGLGGGAQVAVLHEGGEFVAAGLGDVRGGRGGGGRIFHFSFLHSRRDEWSCVGYVLRGDGTKVELKQALFNQDRIFIANSF